MLYGYHLYIDNLQDAFNPEVQLVGATLSRIDQPEDGINLVRLYGNRFSETLDLNLIKQLLLSTRAYTDKEHKHEVAMVKAVNINSPWLNVSYVDHIVGHTWGPNRGTCVVLTDRSGESMVF